MRHYEVAIVLHPDLEIDLENVLKKVEKIFTDLGAKINKKDNWGKKKLAYKINKQDWGIYVFYEIEIDPAKTRDINNRLRITEEVIRYLIVSIEDIRYLKKPNKQAASKEISSKDKNIKEEV
ncbi:MAG: small subunit ribosomal protein [Patescibacteria group bacterium]|nr:small subunit ribosomal protein [Patescibacteria group bacterium]